MKVLIFAVQAVDVGENVPISKKAEKTTSAPRAAKRSMMAYQPAMLATHWTTTIMMGVTLDLFGTNLRPTLSCDAHPRREMGRLGPVASGDCGAVPLLLQEQAVVSERFCQKWVSPSLTRQKPLP